MRVLVTGLIVCLAIVSSSLSQDMGETNYIYVDDNAPADPGPQDSAVSDPDEDGTLEHPFDMIQEGIDSATNGDTVVVLDGMYWESINFYGKSINVTGFNPNAQKDEILPYPIIDGNNQGTVVTFNHGEDPNTMLSGVEIRGGMSEFGSAVQCVGSNASISHCLIAGNRTSDPGFGATIYCVDGSCVIESCTIADNYAGQSGAAIYQNMSEMVISNSIIRGNTPQQIMVEASDDPIVVYCNIEGQWPGEGNIDTDALFANTGNWVDPADPNLMPVEPNDPNAVLIDGDYHLMSKTGRWDPVVMSWVRDKSLSPCIDAGDPASPWSDEPEPNGEQINIGAYGGTTQASKSRLLRTLTISSTNGGSVTTPGEGSFTYDDGTEVEIKASSDQYYYFLKWTGSAVDAGKVADPGSANTTVLVDGDYDLKANFAAVGFTLSTSSTEGGSVIDPGEGSFTVSGNYLISLVAQADPHYHFVNWTGSAVDADVVVNDESAATSVFVIGNYNVKANFEIDTHILSISSTEGGSVTTPGEGDFEYDYGTEVEIVATPDEHYHFVGWTGTAVDAGKVSDPASASTTVSVEGDYTLVANFEIDTYILTVCSSWGGSVTSPGEGTFEYPYGTVVSLTATPEDRYMFKLWLGPVADKYSASTTVTITEDITVAAIFKKKVVCPPN